MSNKLNAYISMIEMIAKALGDDILQEVAFVGGSTTGLLITDALTRETVRYTDDVDLIINVMGYTGWYGFVQKLKERGFQESMEDEVICRLRFNELKVDFMPDDEGALGFSNRWYKSALESAIPYKLTDDVQIRILTAPYFLGTKFEAYKDRGEGDILASQDIEDIMNIINGREEVIAEIENSPDELKSYLADEFRALLEHRDVDYLIQSAVSNDLDRANIIYERIEAIIAL